MRSPQAVQASTTLSFPHTLLSLWSGSKLLGELQNHLLPWREKVPGGWLASSEAEITSTLALSGLGGCH